MAAQASHGVPRSVYARAMRRLRAFLFGLGLVAVAPHDARAFCGFYVGGADAKLYNNATMVVLMREGTRTVLSMQNNYQGPPSDFAMVVPVPVVLQKENVKTLPREVFEHVDALAAPRLVEYWEQDPCTPAPQVEMAPMSAAAPAPPEAEESDKKGLGVRIEARFSVGEYDVLVLSSSDSMGLDTWLHQNRYKIPEGAEPILRPYVQAGMKFFVAKVDIKKVHFEDGRAQLSPLRFHYDAESFSLPVRLGLLNSGGTQDLLVHILARGTRYEVANYPNVVIPTNYDVAETARGEFGAFYAALFDRTVARTPGAVVTEYSWDANSCDPCPTPALEPDSIATLGADALSQPAARVPPAPRPPTLVSDVRIGDVQSGNKVSDAGQVFAGTRGDLLSCWNRLAQGGTKVELSVSAAVGPDGKVREVKTAGPKGLDVAFQGCVAGVVRGLKFAKPKAPKPAVKVDLAFEARLVAAEPPEPPPPSMNPYGFVLTRLHARYGRDALGQDLVFREAPPIEGGREDGPTPLKHGATQGGINNFQARYVIRHPWAGAINCESPRRGIWGGPPEGTQGDTGTKPALKVAFAPRGQLDLAGYLREPVPELGILPSVAGPGAVEPGSRGCGSCGVPGSGPGTALPAAVAAFAALMAGERRRRRERGKRSER
jgi:hypothetical protein